MNLYEKFKREPAKMFATRNEVIMALLNQKERGNIEKVFKNIIGSFAYKNKLKKIQFKVDIARGKTSTIYHLICEKL